MHNGKLVDCRPYQGDFTLAPDYEQVRVMIAAFTPAPVAYTLDVGIDTQGRTLVVEVNDFWAIGAYGLSPEIYAQMLIDRYQLCNFITDTKMDTTEFGRNYLCRFDELATKSVPLRGPMNEEEVISIILAQTNQRLYSNQSRFGLAKYDGYPQTKAGEARLLTDIARNTPLLAELDRLNTAIPVNSCGMYSYLKTQ